MGTHVYLLESIKIPKEATDYTGMITFEQFRDKFDTTTNTSRYIEGDNENCNYARLYSTYTCREILAGYLKNLFYDSSKKLIGNDKTKCLLGIRGLGETYTDVAKAIQKEKGSASVSDFLSKLFKVPMNVTYGFSTEKSKPQQFRPPEGILKLYGKSKPVNGHISLMIDMDNLEGLPNMHILISTIFALLRETRIITGILKGEITNLKTLIKELHSISTDREQREDTSYDCWLLGESTSVLDSLAYSSNIDGSDYYSIAMLALYILGYCKDLLTRNGNGNAGPVYYLQNLPKTQLLSLMEEAKKWELDFSNLLEENGDEDYDEEDEDFYNEDNEDDDE